MLQPSPHADPTPSRSRPQGVRRRGAGLLAPGGAHEQSLEARVKRECAELYPGVDPTVWHRVVLDGEFRDDLEGFWIQVNDWVTYVLSRHFDVQARPELH